MRFTKEFKLECIHKYKNGQQLNDPGGCAHATFMHAVAKWTRIYDSMGEIGLEHKYKKYSTQDKMNLAEQVLSGESITSVAISNGIMTSSLSKWVKKYQKNGIDGLKSKKPGRPLKMKKKSKPSVDRTNDDLLKENEYLRAENEYLKKLNALVQKRKGQQQKKK
ncbi:MAG: transposase [Alphaproteobacteria bacterium]|nr:transposase [Alphaproteobacteria bacterium]